MDSAGLTWVLAGGVPTHVSRFAGLAPRSRPRVTCPHCGRRLTLKLGRILRHHAAHSARHRCDATHPETALHLDLKFHVAACLRAAVHGDAVLAIRRHCAGVAAERCDQAETLEWIRDWDDVVVETRVGSGDRTRPDILLRRAGRAVGAIEVRVSHRVDDAKAAALRAAGVPWVEVLGDIALLEGSSPWSVERPLPVASEGNAQSWGAWRCTRHAAAHDAELKDAAGRRAAEAEAARHRVELRAARVVDVYHPDGARDRVIYRVEHCYLDGVLDALVLRCGTRELARQDARVSDEALRAARRAIADAYAADVALFGATRGFFTDSPMRWATGDTAANIVYEALSDLSPGDATPLATRYPRRWFYDRERRRWFQPRETRVHWDRPDPDAFAPHPAWAESRRKVAERPAPEYAWRGFVFAGRPTVAAFGIRSVTHAGSVALLDTGGEPPPRRVLALLVRAAAEAEVRRVANALAAEGAQFVWLSHPRDWTPARADLAWAPAGRDARGRGVVVVDGVGVYRAEAFARLFARGERRLTPAAISAHSAARVASLSSVATARPAQSLPRTGTSTRGWPRGDLDD